MGRQKTTTEEFIRRAREVHGDSFDYSKTEYKDYKTKVCIICPIHGEFWQFAHHHLSGAGCPYCSGRYCTTELFIKKAKMIHGDKYDYSLVNYKDNVTPVCVICPIHGEFWQRPADHLKGCDCPKCANAARYSCVEDFIAKSRLVHGDKYDYSKVDYKGCHIPVCIICPIHGEFWQRVNDHLNGKGCPICAKISRAKNNSDTTETFIAKAMLRHNGKYSYPNTDYKDSYTPVKIECPIHGEFEQRPNAHLNGRGCPKCAGNNKKSFSDFVTDARNVHGDRYIYIEDTYKNRRTKMTIVCPIHGPFEQSPKMHLRGNGCRKCHFERLSVLHSRSTDDFIRFAKQVHGDRFGYEFVDYKDSVTPVKIICPIHGEFWQTPSSHLSGHSCPHCKTSHGEDKIFDWLNKNKLEHKRQFRITPQQVLFGRNTFIVDFFIPTLNTIIEYHGQQHYFFVPIFHKTEDKFTEQQDRDRRLREHCKQNKIRLIEIPYTEIDNIDKILSKKIKVKS